MQNKITKASLTLVVCCLSCTAQQHVDVHRNGSQIDVSIGGKPFTPAKLLNICYSFAKPDYAFSIVDGFVVTSDTIQLSFADNRTTPLRAADGEHEREAESARSWYANITADMFA